MKLAKKMLASVVALAIVAAFALTAFAAAPVVSLTATEYAKVGDKVEVTVSAAGMAGLESADLEFKYDAEALKFVGIDPAEGAKFSAAGGNPEAGLVTFSLAYMESTTADSGICVITFEVLKDENTEVSFGFTSWAGTEEPAVASATVAKKAAPTTAPTTAAPATEATSKAPTTDNKIPQTGEAGVAAIAGVMALAAVAFVATRKKDEE